MDRTSRMNRLRNILAAGGLTGLVVVTVLALSLRNADLVNSAAGEPTPEAVVDDLSTLDEQAQIDSLKAQNQQLEAALQTMLGREAEYQNQLEAANQTILQLQRQPAPAYDEDDEGEEHEHEEHEHDEGYEHEDD